MSYDEPPPRLALRYLVPTMRALVFALQNISGNLY